MSKDEQKDKVNQVLMMHTNGDPLMAEGLRLTFEALLSAQAKIRTVDNLQQTLILTHSQKIGENLVKIDCAITELTHLLFPYEPEFAGELVQDQYRCDTQ